MFSKKVFLVGASAGLLISSPLLAADLIEADPVPLPVQAASSWTGGYVGVHLGGAFAEDNSGRILFDTDLDGVFGEATDFVPTGAGANAFAPGFCSGNALGNTPAAGCDEDDSGVTGSLRAGYDYQSGAFVFGGLAEVSFVDIEQVSTAFSVTPTFYSIQRELDFTAAARLRAGVASDVLLGYVTGGVVYGDFDRSFVTGNGVNTFTLNDSDDDIGFQLGGGLEYRITDNVTFSLEYLYTRFGDDDTTVRASGGPAGATFVANNPLGTDFALADEDFDYHTVWVGLNYRF